MDIHMICRYNVILPPNNSVTDDELRRNDYAASIGDWHNPNQKYGPNKSPPKCAQQPKWPNIRISVTKNHRRNCKLT